jgi:hypothetical protein
MESVPWQARRRTVLLAAGCLHGGPGYENHATGKTTIVILTLQEIHGQTCLVSSFRRMPDKSARHVERPEGGPQGARSESSRRYTRLSSASSAGAIRSLLKNFIVRHCEHREAISMRHGSTGC